MKQTMSEYDHIQKGVLPPILMTLVVICLGIAFFTKHTPPYMIIFIAAAIACVVLSLVFGHLAVRDEGDCLSVHFGPAPLFRKFIPYSEITAVEKDHSHFLSRWGIHLTRKGWLWNIGGFDCVRIETGAKSTLIGTDDPDGYFFTQKNSLAPSWPIRHVRTASPSKTSLYICYRLL